MTTRKALVVGATGLVGGHCLQTLLADASYSEVIALVRKPLLNTHRKLKVVITTFTNLEQVGGQLQADDVFCCLGTTIKKAGSQHAFRDVDYSLVIRVAEILKRQGAQQFLVVSAMGADSESKVFYNRIKGEMEESLKLLEYPCLRIIRPSLLLGERQEFRFGEKVAIMLTPLLNLFLLGSLKKYRPVEARSVARFMVRLAHEEPGSTILLYESDQIT